MARVFSILLSLFFLALISGLIRDGMIRGDGLSAVNAMLAVIASLGLLGSAAFAWSASAERLKLSANASMTIAMAGIVLVASSGALIVWAGSSPEMVAFSIFQLVLAALALQIAAWSRCDGGCNE